MKIAITCQNEGLDSEIDPRFGRAKGFSIYDTDSKETRYIDNNKNMQAMQGAGIQASRAIIDSGAEALITGNVGPKAFTALNSAGIKIYIGATGTVEKTIDDYLNGRLEKTESANVEGHW